MFFSDEEKKIMEKLFLTIDKDENQTYVVMFSPDDIVEAKVDTCYETDNGVDAENPNYEEYNACAMKIIKIISNKNATFEVGKIIEINYRNYPQQIMDMQGNII